MTIKRALISVSDKNGLAGFAAGLHELGVELISTSGTESFHYRARLRSFIDHLIASGVHGSGTWCYTADFDEEYNEIIGTRGRIRFSTSAPVPIRATVVPGQPQDHWS